MFVEQFTKEVYAKRRQESARLLHEQEQAKAWRLMGSRGMPEWAREIVIECCDEAGVSPLDVISGRRFKRIMGARHAALYHVCARRNAYTSIPKVGIWFGREHTSILYAIAKYAAEHDLPPLTTYSIEKRRASSAGWWVNRRALDRRPLDQRQG
jgi:chromosomal replication initiation ATPase DnaA